MKPLTAFLSLLVFFSSAFAADKPTNVLLIMADDIGFECFSSYGSKEYSTPRLDALAAEGIRFENCHSTPLCTPSRVNLMSGKSNVFNYEDFGVYPHGEPTFANHFKKSGYATAVAGKWQLLMEQGGTSPQEAGFDTYCLWNTPMTSRARYWDPSLESDGKILDLPEGAYGPDVCTDFLADFIESCAETDTPFVAYYPMILVHNPFPVAPNSRNMNQSSDDLNFIDMVNYMDELVGRLVDTLEANGLRDNTLIIFTGDNGTNADLVSVLDGKSIAGGKGYTYDHGTHVPLIANWPGHIPAGQVNDDLIGFSDFFPTIVEAAGLPPKQISDGDGISFWPQLSGEIGTPRKWIYGYYFPRPYADEFDDKYRHWEVRYARDKRYKLYDNGDFYDTQLDVLETTRLTPRPSHRDALAAREKLQAVLDAHPTRGGGVDYSRVNGVPGPKAQRP
ncbi:sulfatase-like hydrolase/transferase [Opitutaceae bacterium]|nr:sulfatase-like hydrolase/transferase [Opitutaceae bacterium]